VKPVIVIDHPLVQHSLTQLRDRRTRPEAFRRALGEAAVLLFYEATRALEARVVRVRTPMGEANGAALKREVILVPVLRAGLGMLIPILQFMPHARVGFIGLKRHEQSLEASVYHRSLPKDLAAFEIVLLDPMLATGGSAVAALDLLAERGAERIRMVNLLAAPEGLDRVHRHYPKVPIFTASVDRRLNSKGFIVPGLGDAGDRLFGV
jgi:uracil phosphoribosyltransferase